MNINELKLNPDNPRLIKDNKFKKLCNSLKEFPKMMQIRPIVIDTNKDNMILGGNMRYRALKELGYKDIPDEWVKDANTLTEEEKQRFIVEDNVPFGEWDFEALANMYDLKDLKQWGFDDNELDIMQTEEDDFDAKVEADKIKEPTSKLGDLYQLGEHRLLCGDATKEEDVKKLMGGVLADIVFTDPPYNVDYDYSKYTDGRKMKWDKVFNDNQSSEDFTAFLVVSFNNLFKYSKDEMNFYVWHADKTAREFWYALEDSGFYVSQRITWVKDRFVLAMGQHFHRMFEPCLHGWKKKQKCYFNKKINNWGDVWNLDKEDILSELDLWKQDRDAQKDYNHPTQKPVSLAERALKKSSLVGHIVLDIFGGSGSTLMACEQLQRKCYMIELDPKYIDVIIKRWEQYTGNKAVKL